MATRASHDTLGHGIVLLRDSPTPQHATTSMQQLGHGFDQPRSSPAPHQTATLTLQPWSPVRATFTHRTQYSEVDLQRLPASRGTSDTSLLPHNQHSVLIGRYILTSYWPLQMPK